MGGWPRPPPNEKTIMKKIITFVIIVFFSFIGLADGTCNCCCCNSPDGPQDPYDPTNPDSGSSTNSSCIQLSPQDCENIKSTLQSRIDDISTVRNSLYEDVIYEVRGFALLFFGEVINSIDSIVIDLSIASQLLDSSDYQLQVLNGLLINMRNRMSTYNSTWATAGTGSLVASNRATHAVVNLSATSNPARWLPIELNHIDSMQSALSDIVVTNLSVRSSLNNVSSGLDSLRSQVQSGMGQLDSALNAADQVYTDLDTISQGISSAASQINCDACSSGGGGGSGGGGSSGTTIDLTPIVNAVNSFKELVEDRFDTLLDTIHNLFSDYDSARTRTWTSSSATYSRYSSLNNWFSRMELLLYSMANLPETTSDTESELPDDSSSIQQASDAVSQDIEGMNTDLATATTSFGDFWDKLVRLYRRFSFLGSSTMPQNLIVLPDYTVGDFTYNLNLEVPSWLDTAIEYSRYLFQALYLLSFASGVWFFVVLLFTNGRKVFEFAIKIYAALFGGGQ